MLVFPQNLSVIKCHKKFATICDNLRQFATIRDNLRQFATIRDNLRQFATICDNLRQFATVRDNSRQFATTSETLQHFATIRGNFVTILYFTLGHIVALCDNLLHVATHFCNIVSVCDIMQDCVTCCAKFCDTSQQFLAVFQFQSE